MSSLQFWSFLLLGVYALVMLGVGLYSRTRIHDADDFATARGSYSPLFPAFAGPLMLGSLYTKKLPAPLLEELFPQASPND